MVIVVLVAIGEWVDSELLGILIAVATASLMLLLVPTVRPSRLAFIVVGGALTLASVLFDPEWQTMLLRGFAIGAFVAAFFAALSTLRAAADSSPGIRRCGRFLAQQPPGRRYAALTVGGQLFALLLNYGSIALLGSLAATSAREEPNPEIRAIRIRRMLLAIQRAFISTLPWSPLSFAIAITTTLLPGTSWGHALLPCFITGLLLAGIGYGMDTMLKPRLSGPRPVPKKPEGSWKSLGPLVLLLLVMFVLAGGLHILAGVRIVGAVIMIVPVVSFLWVMMQARARRPFATALSRSASFVAVDLPSYRNEMTLLMMAAYIGTVGAHLLSPMVASSGIDLAAVPTPVILVLLVWLIPVAGQFGMNPLLAVSLFGPLLPAASVLGVSQTAVLVAITGGWALSGASSPFTATTLLVGSLSGTSAVHVGVRWNGVYSILCAAVLSVWVLAYAYLF